VSSTGWKSFGGCFGLVGSVSGRRGRGSASGWNRSPGRNVICPQRYFRSSGVGNRFATSMGGESDTMALFLRIMPKISPKSVRSKELTALRKRTLTSALARLFGIAVLLCPHATLAQHSHLGRSGMTQQITGGKSGELYGLYYGDCDEEPDCPALVISDDGKPIPPKANDPGAPTLPGLHVGQRLFPFAWSRLSPQGFSFRTARVGHTVYSFQGRFGRGDVDVISAVPYLAGVLTEMRDGRVLLRKKMHFGHAVIL